MTRKDSTIEYSRAGSWWRKIFKKETEISKGDIGIYKYIFLMDTVNEDSHSHRYNIYSKIRAVAVFQQIIEMELLDLHINEPITDEVLAIIKKNFPKYADPNLVKWEVKHKNPLV